MLRQDPVECLFQFVCSSNNHISRIHGMVERLCKAYGTPLHITDKAAAASLPEVQRFEDNCSLMHGCQQIISQARSDTGYGEFLACCHPCLKVWVL